jgi:hypothetical protein
MARVAAIRGVISSSQSIAKTAFQVLEQLHAGSVEGM